MNTCYGVNSRSITSSRDRKYRYGPTATPSVRMLFVGYLIVTSVARLAWKKLATADRQGGRDERQVGDLAVAQGDLAGEVRQTAGRDRRGLGRRADDDRCVPGDY